MASYQKYATTKWEISHIEGVQLCRTNLWTLHSFVFYAKDKVIQKNISQKEERNIFTIPEV